LNLKTAKNGNRECNFNSKLAVLFLQCLHNEESELKGKETRHVEHDKINSNTEVTVWTMSHW